MEIKKNKQHIDQASWLLEKSLSFQNLRQHKRSRFGLLGPFCEVTFHTGTLFFKHPIAYAHLRGVLNSRASWKNRNMNGSRPYMQIEHDLRMFCGGFFLICLLFNVPLENISPLCLWRVATFMPLLDSCCDTGPRISRSHPTDHLNLVAFYSKKRILRK